MKELSVFIDESGDFGEYDYRSPYYIISMVLHDQRTDLLDEFVRLEHELGNMGLMGHCVHAGPVIRQEEEYRYMTLEERRKVLKKTMSFLRRIPVICESFYIEKKHIVDSVEASAKLSKKIACFIREHYKFFLDYDKVIIYYDNGQVEVNKILAAVFNTLLDNVEFRKVLPAEYRLFQVADLVCTIQLIDLKRAGGALSKSERLFFGDERTLKKNYIKPVQSKKLV